MGKIDKISRYAAKRKSGKLRTLAYDSDKAVRMAAIEGLGKVADDTSAENALVMLLGDSDCEITDAAAAALENFSSNYARVRLEYYYAKKKDKVALETLRASYTQENQAVKDREW